MKVVGLTGGIASGKSSVAKLLEDLGAAVIDADQLSREAVLPGTAAFQAIIDTFGRDILAFDGTINRKVLGHIVFSDPESRCRLEAITHPAIQHLAEQKLAELRRARPDIIIYMAPLLIEAGSAARVDEIWVVYVDEETQIRRVMERDGLSREEAMQRLAAQMPMKDKVKYGKVVIDNRGSFAETEATVRAIWEREVG